ncbi:MAG: ATP synthase F1 subunit epsilon [Buchnera aphidicola (Meitanaphis microgallis)]
MVCYLSVVNPEELIYSGIINKIQVSGDKGEFGVYPGHLQLLSCLKAGILYILDENNNVYYIYLSGGIIEIQPQRINILTNIFFKISKLDKKSILMIENDIKKKLENSFIVNKKRLLKELPYELKKLYSNKTFMKIN